MWRRLQRNHRFLIWQVQAHKHTGSWRKLSGTEHWKVNKHRPLQRVSIAPVATHFMPTGCCSSLSLLSPFCIKTGAFACMSAYIDLGSHVNPPWAPLMSKDLFHISWVLTFASWSNSVLGDPRKAQHAIYLQVTGGSSEMDEAVEGSWPVWFRLHIFEIWTSLSINLAVNCRCLHSKKIQLHESQLVFSRN